MIKLIKKNYIEEIYIQKLKDYKYKGGDNSIFCRYCINPFCNFLVQYFPKWMAPNVITVSGWFLNLFYTILTITYSGWKGTNYYPPWICFISGVSYVTYIILDYIDGKQARRLGASSPLGLLVDHGTDACTTFFVSIGIASLFYFESFYEYFFFYIGVSSTFFLNTWEEYYIGELILPIIHGVSEGTIIIFISCTLSGIFGYSFFTYEFSIFDLFTLNFRRFACFFPLVFGPIFGITSIINVFKKIPKERREDAIKNLSVYLMFILSILSIATLNNSIIVKDYPKLLILTFGLEFAKLMGILQLSHILECPYRWFTPVFMIPIFACLIHSLYYYFMKSQLLISIDIIIFMCLIWNFLSWAHFVYFCSEQICEVLNIHRFVLGKRYSETQNSVINLTVEQKNLINK